MSFAAKHRAARTSSPLARVVGVAIAGGALMIGGLAAAPVASAAPAAAPAAPASVWDRVAACESGGNWSISTGNGYYGGLQFAVGSWRAAGGTQYASMPHRATKAQQIATAQRLLRMQGPGAWPVCSRKAGLTRANGGSSGAVAAARTTARPAAATSAKSSPRVKTAPRAFLTRAQNRQIQSWVGAKRTGFIDRPTVSALQRKTGVTRDGVIGHRTVAQTERHVNAKRTGAPYFTKPTLNKMLAHARAT